MSNNIDIRELYKKLADEYEVIKMIKDYKGKMVEHKPYIKNARRISRITRPITKVLLLPIFLFVRIYCWVWDYDYKAHFNH